MTIEESMSDDENKDKRIKTERTARANGIGRPKLHVNNDICYCDRAPGSSRSIAAKPHLKASYCVETEGNKAITATAAAATAANKNNEEKTTRDSSSGDKLSPVARDFGARNKTTRSQDAVRSDDIFAISHESFPESFSAKSRLKKSIFSCVSPVGKTKPSTVVIEELPSDEAYEKPTKSADSSKAKVEAKKETSLKEGKSKLTKKSYANNNKESIPLEKESRTKISSTPSKIQTADKCEKSRKTIDSSEARVEIKKKTKEERSTSKESNVDENKKLISSEKEGKAKKSTSEKMVANECRKDGKWEMDLRV